MKLFRRFKQKNEDDDIEIFTDKDSMAFIQKSQSGKDTILVYRENLEAFLETIKEAHNEKH